jgi:predicted NAD/FAD-dependent oxidoreductase
MDVATKRSDMAPVSVAVVGAGMAGLTCAGALAQAGFAVTVYDKSRGLGGRLATRRSPVGTFDHGAIAVRAQTPDFAAYLAAATESGAAAACRDGLGWVGLPGMSGIVRPLAEGLTIRTATEVTAIRRDDSGWHLTAADTVARHDLLVLAIPQPQAVRLCAGLPSVAGALAGVAMRPVWAVLMAFDRPLTLPVGAGGLPPLVAVTHCSAKAGRVPMPDRWVLHADADWSRRHLEQDKDWVAHALCDTFFAQTGLSRTATPPIYLEAHRWRFGLTDRALGQSCLHDPALGLGLCGDWCLGDDAEAAHASGLALAAAFIGSFG